MDNNQASSDGTQLVTREGLEKLKNELNSLKNVRRREIAERIERAKELGDLYENAEYAEAKEEQAFNEGRILEIEATLKKLTVVENNKSGETIDLGSKVKVERNGKEKNFILVSFNEVDPENNKISNESPIGEALMGHKAGDEVKVQLPSGAMKYKILSVS
ncbi:transcription elongation factor GreA [Candidatus Falkowbacteria bacterium CG10_big_fil_rev_8_21_14_0_10_43_10]|uniref:Transcription elongation factor GreA n=1 Tax=Candidatus Falkowbacteria bacterium CG10_big_fil_rev_8_21_14_0_10_43_10 TaxID=1974567 RepID=A0A2H0V491_9BACT|nr:MAG: transcription elongation factor GreA [Candidatus Falkowbacteria bacterium CG10_big_fil_rev_8_21_14_0_10_43_10]